MTEINDVVVTQKGMTAQDAELVARWAENELGFRSQLQCQTYQRILETYQRCQELEKLYYELLYEVATKFPDETRHETARRYIHDHETICGEGGPAVGGGSSHG